MEKKLKNLGFEQHSIRLHKLWELKPRAALKNVVFDYLKSHQFDVSIYSLHLER